MSLGNGKPEIFLGEIAVEGELFSAHVSVWHGCDQHLGSYIGYV
jgi:hypothetical protein